MARADRTGRRKNRTEAAKRVPKLGYYFIVTDAAETEVNYLNGLKKSLPARLEGRIVIKVSKAKVHEPLASCKEAAALHPQYAERWIVFDRDQVPGFDKIIQQADIEGVNVGWSNPCIEVWFNAYFGKMNACIDSVTCCRNFSVLFEKITGQEYIKSSSQIYELLSRNGDEVTAINIAERRLQGHLIDGKNIPSEMFPCTTLHRLVDEIRRKTIGR